MPEKDVGQQFWQLTKYPNLTVSDQQQGSPPPPVEQPCPDPLDVSELPDPAIAAPADASLFAAMEARRSRRKFSSKPMTLEQLSWLLWSTAGVRDHSPQHTLRRVPSAGARHPMDTWLAVNNVEGLEQGIYRYLALEHKLAFIKKDENISSAVTEACLNQRWMQRASVIFLWVANPYRCQWRYSERAWRYMLLDSGHICQNLYLACEAAGLGTCAVAAYDDDALNQLLGLDGNQQFVIYVGPAGTLE